jgi:serine/threonine protein kinase
MYHTTGFTTDTGLKGSIRWMAPELLGFDSDPGRPTVHSDAYSLAIVWWEVYKVSTNPVSCSDTVPQLTTGKVPYHELLNEAQVVGKLYQGHHLSQPDNVHPHLWPIMLECWQRDPQTRPSVRHALDRLEEIATPSPSDSDTSAVPWIFQWTHDIVPIPIERDRDAMPVSPGKIFFSDEPETVVGRRTSKVVNKVDVDEDGVENFEQMLEQLDDPASWTLVSAVPSPSSSMNLEEFSYARKPEGMMIYKHLVSL